LELLWNSTQVGGPQDKLSFFMSQLFSCAFVISFHFLMNSDFFRLTTVEVLVPTNGLIAMELNQLPGGAEHWDIHKAVLVGYDHSRSSYNKGAVLGDDVDHAGDSSFDQASRIPTNLALD
jgi:hypothetical protein